MIRAILRSQPRLPGPVAPGEVVLRANDLHLSLGGTEILRGVSLEVRAGELVALVGPNGAGKSTLLAALAGDREPDSGSVEIHGEPVGTWTQLELAMRRAVLLQRVEMTFPFAVAEVIRMGREPWRNTDLEDEDLAATSWAVDATDVSHLLDRSFPTLSGGEQARVALARTLSQRTALLMLDEPTAALDIAHQEQVLQVARDRAGAGDGVVVVLHDLGLAAAYSDRVVILADGRVAANGAPDEVMTDHLLSSIYGCRIETMRHPRTGALLVFPVRDPACTRSVAPVPGDTNPRPLITEGAT